MKGLNEKKGGLENLGEGDWGSHHKFWDQVIVIETTMQVAK